METQKESFPLGSELDKQIYKEGEPTWGCKSGVLDVEDVKEFIEVILNGLDAEFKLVEKGTSKETAMVGYMFKQVTKRFIRLKAGEKLLWK